jgi:hypothetical protein
MTTRVVDRHRVARDPLLARLYEQADELDAASWRVGLVPEDAVRRAVVQAQAARDTRREVFGTNVRGSAREAG